MSRRDVLGEALREVSIPIPGGAEERGRRVVEAALEERASSLQGGRSEPWGARTPTTSERRSRRPLPRLALALALATLLAALLLSPAGAAVRGWVDDVLTTAPRPEPTLGDVPGGGRLLVQSAEGPWVVQPDGSRRLLGDYEEATWSPRGLYVAVAEGRTLSAVEPDGTPHWSSTAPARVSDPRWAPFGTRIAYRSGRTLRVIVGDGTADRLVAGSSTPIAPSWSPLGDPTLAYVSRAGALRLVNSESRVDLAAAPALDDVAEIEWGANGDSILEASRRALRLREVQPRKLPPRPSIEVTRPLPVSAGATVVDAALAPARETVAAVLTNWRDHGTRSSVVVYGPGEAKPRRLLTVPGSLGEIAWSPDGRRLLVTWPAVNEWLFLPLGRGRESAVANISRAFAPGGRAASFPRVDGWCCHR
jgi:dipeptidyl aminopeptidase/acylaminoacyl peptidase